MARTPQKKQTASKAKAAEKDAPEDRLHGHTQITDDAPGKPELYEASEDEMLEFYRQMRSVLGGGDDFFAVRDLFPLS